jgi:hypothetical protein
VVTTLQILFEAVRPLLKDVGVTRLLMRVQVAVELMRKLDE